MNSKDQQILTLGVVVLFIVLIGSATMEGEEDFGGDEGGGLWQVKFSEKTQDYTSESENCDEGETIEYEYDLSNEKVTNIVGLKLTLTWDDDQPHILTGDNDEFSVEAEFGNKSDDSGSSSSGNIGLDFFALDIPKDKASESGTQDGIVEKYNSTEGLGVYKVRVTCENAGGDGVFADSGNDFSLDVKIIYYEVATSKVIVGE